MNQDSNQNNDDQNKDVIVVPSKQSSGGIINYIKNNKFIVLLAVVILILLVWYFCFRKPKTVTGTSPNVPTGTPAAPVSNPGKMQITKTRISNTNAK